ncbi:MAG: hypothetical protein EOP84_03310 [Verrucomicrobiaceae bacterium]|nr:MAG: hypothetical protein EOP84_03310 [Verrucomicrobiaceae bacterium]
MDGRELSLEGAGPALSKIIAPVGWNDRIFDIWADSLQVRIAGVSISGGRAGGDPGGGINNFNSRLTVSNCMITNCIGRTGGGIDSGFDGSAALTVVDSEISGNQSEVGGGGISCSGGVISLLRTRVASNTTITGGAGLDFGTAMAPLNVTDCTISQNAASWNGGGGVYIDDDSSVTFTNTVITENTAELSGGGIFNAGTVKLIDCAISGNIAKRGSGGGITSTETVVAISCTISSNSAAYDGGGVQMFNAHRLELTNCTISANIAKEDGGGIYLDLNNMEGGSVAISGSTITNNICNSDSDYSGDGGGIYWSRSPVTIQNTIIARNFDGLNNVGPGTNYRDYSGTMISAGYNLIGNTTGTTITGTTTGNKVNIDAKLGTLKNNGGRTLTHALLTGSPALDAGSNALVANEVRYDQRGSDFSRIHGGAVDIGAYEAQPLTSLQSWRQTHFGNAGNFDESENSADPDGDGLANLLEFALRLDPNSSVSPVMAAPGTGISGLPLVFFTPADSGRRLSIEFVRRKGGAAATGARYNVQFAQTPGMWSVNSAATEVTTSIDATWERVRVTDSLVDAPQRFVRLQIQTIEDSSSLTNQTLQGAQTATSTTRQKRRPLRAKQRR